MKKAPFLAFAPAAVALVIAGCGGSGGAYSNGSSNPAVGVASTVALTHSKYGNILVDGQGRTLYLFEADRTSASTCYSSCASVRTTSRTCRSGPAGSARERRTTASPEGGGD